MNNKKKILFVLQYDSFINTFIPIFFYFKENKIYFEIVLFIKWYKKNWIDDKIRESLIDYNYLEVKTTKGVFRYLDKNFDICIFGTTGERFILNYCHYIKNNGYKTKVVTGFIGATLNNNKIKFIRGVKHRSLSNLIFAPGKKTKEQIMNTFLIKNVQQKVKVTGLPRFEAIRKIYKSKTKTNNILFIEQPTYPRTKEERYELVQKLIVLANQDHNKKIIIKPRFNELIGHAHRPRYLLQDIIKEFTCPDNIYFKYKNIYEQFKNIDLALTISSTAGLEALRVGIPTYFINDFCNNQNKYGSKYFEDLNAVISFFDIYNKKFSKINYNKIEDYIDFSNSSARNMAQEILKL